MVHALFDASPPPQRPENHTDSLNTLSWPKDVPRNPTTLQVKCVGVRESVADKNRGGIIYL